MLMILLAFLMVSTLKYHGAKEIDFKRRKPFWILVAIVLVLMIIITHPPISLFILAMIYLFGGLAENLFLFYRKRRKQAKEGIPR